MACIWLDLYTKFRTPQETRGRSAARLAFSYPKYMDAFRAVALIRAETIGAQAGRQGQISTITASWVPSQDQPRAVSEGGEGGG